MREINIKPTPNAQDQLTKLEWYDPGDNGVADYFQTTSIHGLQYLGKPKLHLCERFIWVLSVIAAVATSGYLISKIWERYRNNPMVTTLNLSPVSLEEIPFPSVTICSLNNVEKSYVDGFVQTIIDSDAYQNVSRESLLRALAAMHDIKGICTSAETFVMTFRDEKEHLFFQEFLGNFVINETQYAFGSDVDQEFKKFSNPSEILHNGSQPCSEMLLLCVWLDKEQNCSELFQEISTDFGICCTFNMIPEALLEDWRTIDDMGETSKYLKDWKESNLTIDTLVFTSETINRKYPARQKIPGRTSGLSVLLNPALDEYFCSNTDSEGFVIGLQNSLDMPRVRDEGIAVKSRSEVFMGIRPNINIGDNSIKSFPPLGSRFGYLQEIRQCYFRDEKTLAFYSKYTQFNCIDECISNLTRQDCQCIQYYMPRGTSDNDTICSVEGTHCVRNVMRKITRNGIKSECKSCLPSCSDINYESETTSVYLRYGSTGDLLNHYFEFDDVNAREVSLVHIFFKEDSTYPKLRKEDFGLIDLLSNSGGLLGLCMGLSALSILEILYHCMIHPLFRCYRKIAHEKEHDNDIHLRLGIPSYQSTIIRRNQQDPLTTILILRNRKRFSGRN